MPLPSYFMTNFKPTAYIFPDYRRNLIFNKNAMEFKTAILASSKFYTDFSQLRSSLESDDSAYYTACFRPEYLALCFIQISMAFSNCNYMSTLLRKSNKSNPLSKLMLQCACHNSRLRSCLDFSNPVRSPHSAFYMTTYP